MFVHKQVKITYCKMMKTSNAESQQLKTKYYTQNTTTLSLALSNNQERLIILVEIGIQCI